MAEAILGGLPPVNWDCTQASDYNTARAGVFKERFGIRVSLDNAAVVEGAKVVILAVKPQNVDTALSTVRDSMDPNCVLVSIVAGVPMADLQRLSGCPAVVRTMPNTPAMIGKGITVWCATDAVDDDKASKVKSILRAMGDEILVQDENLLDMATAISGSGPAYHYMMMEAMVETGVHMGFSRDVARELVVKTMRGSVEYVIATGEHPAQLRNDITSPGGTTAAALYEMEKGRFRTVMADSLWAAYRRSLEMGGHDASIGPVSQRRPAHCFSAVSRPFSAVFPPSLCVARLPGAETERTGEKWRKMGEIWGRNGRETAVAEWRWGQARRRAARPSCSG